MLFAALSAIGKFFSLMGGIIAVFAKQSIFRSGEQIGEQTQEISDLKGSLKDAVEANKIDSAVGTLNHDQLVEQLRDDQANRQRMLLDKTD